MSRMKLLLDVVNDMRSLADSIETLANATADGDVQKKEQPTQQKENIPQNPKQPAVTHEMIRELAVKLSRCGKREEIKHLLDKYGVKNVTAVKEDDLDTFYAELAAMEVE